MTIYAKHPNTGRDVGCWQRSFGSRWWEGPCTCGSGREGHEVYDHHGIYFGIACTSCQWSPGRKPRELGVTDDGTTEDWDEPIEEDF
jgi:hypothetical protein